MAKGKGKGKGKGGVTIFEERRQQRMGELGELEQRKTTRKMLPKLEKALGITSMRSDAYEPEEPKVPAGVGGPMEYTGKARRRKTKKAGRRRSTRRK